MNARLAKVLGLILTLALVLSGCNLIEVDADMQADEDIAKLDKQFSQVVATYDGGEVTADDVMGEFTNNYSQTYYMYQYYFGYTMTADEVHSLMEDSNNQHVRNAIVAGHFDEAMELTAEELTEVETLAQENYDSVYEGALDAAEGKTDKEKQANARVLLKQEGLTYDSIYASQLVSAKVTKMEQSLRDAVTEVSDEELQAAYDAKLTENQENYTDGSSFESDMTGDSAIVCWIPEGYRTVKHILVIPEDDLMSAYTTAVSDLSSAQSTLEGYQAELAALNDDDAAEDARTAEEIQADIDAAETAVADAQSAVEAAARACLNSVKDKTDEIYARLEAGEDFEALIAEYGEDPGMQNEPTSSRGYYVSAASTNWEANFRDAAMALENVGDYTMEPVISGSGVHIIRYESDVTAGPVALDEVRDALYEQALTEKQEANVTDTIDAWVAERNVSVDADAFESAYTGEE